MAATIGTTAGNNFQRAYDNYSRILVLVTEAIANPTQSNIDAIVTAAQTNNLVLPKPTTTEDGATYNWMEFQQFIITQMKTLKQLIQMEQAPIYIPTRYKT